MKRCWLSIAVVFELALPVLAADKAQPVRMGCGLMTFDTVPGWGLGPDGKSALGPTHGGVVDRQGRATSTPAPTKASSSSRPTAK